MNTPNRDREALEAAPDIELKVSRSRSSLLVGERIDVEVVAPSNLRKQAARLAAFFNHFSPTRVRALLDERDAMGRELELWHKHGSLYEWVSESGIPVCSFCEVEANDIDLTRCRHADGCEVAELERLRDAREGKR